jgi:hypothetical protein
VSPGSQNECASGFFHWRATGAQNLRRWWIRPTGKTQRRKTRHCAFASGADAASWGFAVTGESGEIIIKE